MNNFRAKLISLVPELANYELETGNAMDKMIFTHNTIVANNIPNPGDGYYLCTLTGISVERTPEGKVLINVSNDLVDVLTDEQMRGLILHEVGHLRNGDMEEGNIKPNSYVNEADREIAADRYALDNGVSKEDLMSAIVAVTQHGLRQFITWLRFMVGRDFSLADEEKAIAAVVGNFPIHEAARYNALINA
jgi:hypothetical protein